MKFPLRHPQFFQWPNIYNSSSNGIKARKVGRIDMKITNILLVKMNNVFSVKHWQKVCTKLRKFSFKNCNMFSASDGGTLFFNGQRFIIVLASVSKQER